MLICRLHSFNEYEQHRDRMTALYAQRRAFERALRPAERGPFTVPGFSYPAGQVVDFAADFVRPYGDSVNWRETLVCPVTGLNNRLRAVVHLADTELGLLPDQGVYITEHVTPLYKFMQTRYAHLVSSEYLGTSSPLGHTDLRGVRNEDLTQLTFPAAEFDAVLSFDCFEHIPDFPAAIREIARILKPGGRLMWSVPFRANFETNLSRATVAQDGSITHHEPAEYHGDPVNSKGCLCFTHFGWQMLDQVRKANFQHAYALAYWSNTFGYLGVEQFTFVATR